MLPYLNGRPPVIPPESIILVTGVNGYIGSHVADQLIQAGYIVRGTTRNIAKTAWLKDMFDAKYGGGKFEAVVVEDMEQPRAFDEACKGVAGVAHVASIVNGDPDPNQVIPGVVAGALNVLSAASKTPSIKRFVYTSSAAAISLPKPNVELNYSTEDWNIEAIEAAWKPPPYEPERAWAVYAASKTEAEQMMWEFIKEEKPGFVFNTILPNSTFGQIFSAQQPASSGGLIRKAYYGDITFLKNLPPQWMVDVKDTARLHVAALIDPEVENERILGFAYPFKCNDILACLRRLHPDRDFPNDIEDDSRDVSKVDNRRGKELLKKFGRPGWTGLEESIRENTACLG